MGIASVARTLLTAIVTTVAVVGALAQGVGGGGAGVPVGLGLRLQTSLAPGTAAWPGDLVEFTVLATDSQPAKVTLSLLNPPPGCMFAEDTRWSSVGRLGSPGSGRWVTATGRVRWLVPFNVGGLQHLTFCATDRGSLGRSVSMTVDLRVEGESLASTIVIGDVTGDGVLDTIANARGADVAGMTDAGAVYVWKGTSSPSGVPDATLVVSGAVAYDALGNAWKGQGTQLADVTGDGVLDVVVGAYAANFGANKHREPALAEALFWQMLDHLKSRCPTFAGGRAGRRLAGRFTRAIHVVDSTTLELIASCLDWARHRRRKAAAKCHLRLDLQSFLPRFVLVDTARHADGYHARTVCAGLRAGEIVLLDRAYADFAHLYDLGQRGVFWITRAKESHQFRVVKKLQPKPAGKILRDELVLLQVPATRAGHPARLRRIVALVEVDGQEVEMTFLTNNLAWAASSVVALYKERWQIEVFSNRSSRRCKWPIIWATARRRCAGRCGRRCWSMCSCALRRCAASGA